MGCMATVCTILCGLYAIVSIGRMAVVSTIQYGMYGYSKSIKYGLYRCSKYHSVHSGYKKCE